MRSFQSIESPKGKRESSNNSKYAIQIKELIKEEKYNCNIENEKSSSKLQLTKKEEKNSSNLVLNLSNPIQPIEIHTQNKFFDMIDFDKLG